MNQILWEFVRGDLRPEEFERWVYATPSLEPALGPELYHATISANYSSAEDVWRLRHLIGAHVRERSPGNCMCIRLRHRDVVDMGTFRAPTPAFQDDREWSHQDVLATWEEVKSRGEPYWWLWAARCRCCGQGWLVGQEERQNDIFCVKRLSESELQAIAHEDRWPPDFDAYETLLRMGVDAGRSVQFLDPEKSSMPRTIADLARARPGIAVTEIARLLGVEAPLATALAAKAVATDGVTITFDGDGE